MYPVVLAELLEQAAEASVTGITISDAAQPDMPLIFANRAFELLTGYRREEVIGKNCRFLQQSDHDQPGLTVVRQALERGEACTVVVRNYRKDGSLFWNQLQLSPVRAPDGQITHYIGIQQDVTEREALQERLRGQADLLETVSDAVISTDTQYSIRSWNRAAEMIYGWKAYEVLGLNVDRLLRTEFAHDVMAQAEASLFRDGRWQGEVTQQRRDGQRIPILSSVTLMRDGAGQPVGAVAVNRDMSEHLRAEAIRRESERRFHLIGLNSPDVIYSLDLVNHRLTFLNRDTFCGYSREELMTSGLLLSQVHPDDRDAVVGQWQRLLQGEGAAPVVSAELRMRRKDGGWEWLQNRYTILSRADDGTPQEILVTVTIITERKQAEAELHEYQLK